MRLTRCVIALIAVFLAGCDRRVEPWIDPADEEPPPERPVRIPGLGSPTPSLEASRGRAVGPPRSAPRDGLAIRGTVQLAEGVRAASTGVLFVIARSGQGGPPLAVKRLPPGPFPLPFEIGPADVMIAGRPFEGPIVLSARIDLDGDPISRGPEDPSATLAGTVEPGATGVSLVLSPGG